MERLPLPPWTDWLRVCRHNLGSRTGDFWRENRRRLEISPLLRPGRGDALDRLWKDQELLFTRGDVQLAMLVRPDEDVTPPAWVGRPVLVVHTPDARFAAAPDELVELVTELPYCAESDPRIEALFDDLGATSARGSWIPVPEALARGRECYVSLVYLHRGAMPDRWLAGEMFPVLCLRDETPAITLLPFEYWPADLVRTWREVEPPAGNAVQESIVIRGYAWPAFAFFLGSLFAVEYLFTLATGETDPLRKHPERLAIALTIGALLLFVFDRLERKRAFEPRYFSADDGHPLTVSFDRRFAFLPPRVLCALALGFSLFAALITVIRR